MIWFVIAILILLVTAALIKGFDIKAIAKMGFSSMKSSFIVVGILLLIGCLTGLWRVNGTIAYFITLGISIMPPSLFVLCAFLLSSLMSFAIGTSFGVAATAGVILMSIARAGGIDPIPVAGAVMSGLYVGDRNSPASSAAALVSALTDTDININIRKMLKTSAVPLAACLVIYTGLSFAFPMQSVDTGVINKISESFTLNWICIVPAVLMIILPFAGVPVKISMAIDIIISFFIAISVQHAGFAEVLKTMLLGFSPEDEMLSKLLSGGGVRSLLKTYIILLISGTYGGIIKGTGILEGIDKKIAAIREKIGRYPCMILLSAVTAMIFCNQTATVIMTNQLGRGMYGDRAEENYNRMLDIENSSIVIAGMVPWCIACSVPFSNMGVGTEALPFSFYLYLLPGWRLIADRKHARSG